MELMNPKIKIAAIITTISLCALVSGPAQASLGERPNSEPAITAFSVPSQPVLKFEKPTVTTTPAPVKTPVPVLPTPKPVAPTAPILVESSALSTAKPVVAPPAAPVPPSGKGAAILSAALGQIGMMQDCTMLVTNALKSVGISFHDWPAGYFSLGTRVSAAEAMPGDLLYYADGGAGVAHIAVYMGNGQAVHGGFNGNETRIFSANVGSGPVFIRVR